MEKVKPVILMITDYYLPGFESGGQVRTLVNMVDRLSDYQFKIVTRDHDGTLNRTSYKNVRIGDWNRVGNADVYYLSKNDIRIGKIIELIRETSPDAIYVNSFFSVLTIFTLILRRSNRIGPIPIILAPEGEIIPGPLSIKPLKKGLYIRAAKLLKLLDKVIWKAASDYESEGIKSIFGNGSKIFIAPNMPPKTILDDFNVSTKPEKIGGQAKIVFLSRFMRKKNFNWFLDIVRKVKGDLTIDIYGPKEEADYLNEYHEIAKILPENVRTELKGSVSHEEVPKTLAQYHFFVLPTLGENFGHIFIEALAAGCPVITSDRTPWRDLERLGIGWDLALENPERWSVVVDHCIEIDKGDYCKMSQRARDYAVSWLSDPAHEKSNRDVLEFALSVS